MVRLHWVAIAGFIPAAFLIYLVQPHRFKALLELFTIPAIYTGSATIYLRRYRKRRCPLIWPSELQVIIHGLLILDLIVAALAIHVTGGVESFLIPIYLVIVPASALIISRLATYIYASLALVLMEAVFGLEYAGLLPHYHMYPNLNGALHRQGSFVVPRLAFLACFLYLSAYFTSNLVSKLETRKRQVAQAQALSQSIFDAIGHGIVVLDPQSNILRFNQFMQDTYGWTGNDLARNIFELCPDLEDAGLREQLKAIVDKGQPAEFRKLRRVTQQGQDVYQNLWGYPLYQDAEIAGAVVVIEDITKQTQLEQDLQEQITRREVIAQLSHQISSILELDHLLEETVSLVAEAFDYYNVTILLLDETSGDLVYRAEAGHSHVKTPTDYRQALGEGMIGWVAQTGQPLLSNNVRQEPHYLSHLPDTQSELDVPLKYSNEVLGVLDVQSTELNAFGEEDLAMLQILADQIAIAIENARLYAKQEQTEEVLRQRAEETRRRNEELAARNAIARAVSRSLDIDDILKQLYQEVNQLLKPDTFFVALYNEGEKIFDVALVIEHGEELPRFSAKLDETGGLTAWVIRECQPLLIRDLPAEVDSLPADPKHLTEPARSWLGVPLMARGQVIGVLSVQSFEPNAFDEIDQRFLTAVADHIAMAIDNAQLYEETRHMAVTDGLTGLYNSRYFYQALEQELSRSERYRHPLSLIMLDLDDFKKYNDLYGHLAGDDLLKELAGLIFEVTRETDVAARYGGEEFAIILPETTADDAAKLAERLRKRVEQHEFEVENGQAVGQITISAGIATHLDDAGDVKELVHRADMALLDAKITKNTVR